MAYLRYYPFRVIATPREQHILIVGHLIIFAIEFLLVTALFASGLAPMAGSAFHKLYFICYWPHFFLRGIISLCGEIPSLLSSFIIPW